jgi:Tfp pilus assembly protein PilX
MKGQRRHHQRGAITLFVSLIILIGIIAITGNGSRQAVLEQSSSASDRRAKEAFEAADAGVEKAITFLQANSATVAVDANNDGFIDAYSNPAITNASLVNGSKFSVTYSNSSPGNLDVLDVTSIGTSIDGSVTRTVRVSVVRIPTITSSVSAGIIAKNAVTMSGNSIVTNTVTNPTIWSGGTTSLSGSASTSGQNGVTSDKNAINGDVLQNDNNISSLSSQQFFMNFFNAPPDTVRNNADIHLTNPGSLNTLDGISGKVIWVDQTTGTAQLNSNVTIGSPTEPVVLIINGNLSGNFQLNGGATIYGVVYTTGDWLNSGGGTANIFGSAIVNGQYQSTGTPNITYEPAIIANIKKSLDIYTKIPGSWRDV